jgi:hypothetical protein
MTKLSQTLEVMKLPVQSTAMYTGQGSWSSRRYQYLRYVASNVG